MARISRAHPVRVALVICVVATLEAFSLSPPPANAGALEQVTGPVEEVVSPVVQATPSVQEVEEAVTATTQGVTATMTPPAATVPDVASSPPVAAPGALPGHPMTTVNGAASSLGSTIQAAEDAVNQAKEGAETAARTTLPPPPVAPPNVDPADPAAGAPRVTDPADSAAAPIDPPPGSRRTTYVPAPTKNGATGSPLPRWVAYVWPAVALTGPYLAAFGERWGLAITKLATGASAGHGAEGAVAGVHAAGGRPEAAGSSPLFSRIPSDAAHAFSSVPTPVFIYLGLLALAVIAVAVAVRREIVIGRRQ